MNVELDVTKILQEGHNKSIFNQYMHSLGLSYKVINDRLISIELSEDTYLDEEFLSINILRLIRELSNMFQITTSCKELNTRCLPEKCSYTLYKLKVDDTGIHISDSLVSSESISSLWMHLKYKVDYKIEENNYLEYDIIDSLTLSKGRISLIGAPLGVIIKSNDTFEDINLYNSIYYLIGNSRII